MRASGDGAAGAPPTAAAASQGAVESAASGAGAPVTGAPAIRSSGPIQRGAALRRELVTRLAQLPVGGDSAGATKVDPTAADLDADAFIGPLYGLVSEGKT